MFIIVNALSINAFANNAFSNNAYENNDNVSAFTTTDYYIHLAKFCGFNNFRKLSPNT
jgi:hypothetical protein